MNHPKVLWTPKEGNDQHTNLGKYIHWLDQTYDLQFDNYQALWEWSCEHYQNFWESLVRYFEIDFKSPYQHVCRGDMPNAKWFEGGTLNYAAHVFRHKTDAHPAIIAKTETGSTREISWKQLEQWTASIQHYLVHELQLSKGDRIVAYGPNIPEISATFLASAASGFVWSSTSTDFGSEAVIDRFKQINPKVLVCVDGYTYNGKPYLRQDAITEIMAALPDLEAVIVLPYVDSNFDVGQLGEKAINFHTIVSAKKQEVHFDALPFEHPIWVLFSSGTTGRPKAITHGHGGMLLEHLKYMSLHNDVHSGERFFWYTTTGWMMWNFVHASLLVGATAVLYEGSVSCPDLNALWALSEDVKINHFGTSAPFIIACMKRDIHPSRDYDLSDLRSIGSTGAPLPPDGFKWIYDEVKEDVWLMSMSGGTDICTAWVGGNPHLKVYQGEIQCRCLGCEMYAYDEEGKAIYGEVGEMVVTKPMPCMPIYFWNDSEEKERYQASYFDHYPGIWRHGDWLEITERNSLVIHGRSDATLNRQGIRIGTAEIYRALHPITRLDDSLIINLELPNGDHFMPLFVKMKEGNELTEDIQKEIKSVLRSTYSPRHVPDAIIEVPDLPYTISGKKLEAPIKKILMGKSLEKSVNMGALKNPEAVQFFVDYKEELKGFWE